MRNKLKLSILYNSGDTILYANPKHKDPGGNTKLNNSVESEPAAGTGETL